ncbi:MULTISPECIES: winged helix-turn-helix domain-containing protein [unclassified Pseudomonas]|uniref:winged helix-turn-helix domain-containing protein n=1 Tax=unclassified Pseudomonas TaxID=196821 RepID=UPI0015AEFEEB|nr:MULTISPECIES: winged helix-turn-helix domain-containing protein [unclassified Pseudomonas]
MNYVFRLKRGEVVTFDPEYSTLSILSPNETVDHHTLGRAESRLLSFLLSAPGSVKSRAEIVEHVWDDRIVASGSLNQAIFSLRAILNDSREHEILMTVPRRGYRFNRQYVIDDAGHIGDTEDLPIRPTPSEMLYPPTGIPTLLSMMPPMSNRRKLLLGYAVVLPLLVVALVQAPEIEESRIQITNAYHDKVTLHFIAATRDKASEFQHMFAADQAKLPVTLKGEVWLLSSKNTYAVSCIRADGSTSNLKFDHNSIKPMEVVQQCLESAL